MLDPKQADAFEIKAREIAHEINNPLAIIKTKAYLLQRNPKDLESSLETISRMADRISALVKELQECARDASRKK